MRNLAVILILVLVLSGCTQNQTIPQQTPNQTNYSQQPVVNMTPPQPNVTAPVVSSGNITTAIQLPPSQNSTTTNSTQTLNQTANVSINQTTNSTQTPATLQPVGLVFPDSNYTLVLDDVSLVPTSEQPCGIFSIRDPNNSILDKQLICPSQEASWVSPEGHLYNIQVIKVAAGYSTHMEWASVQIFG